jgi:N-dimethylarginine dimethylaminohydrolase
VNGLAKAVASKGGKIYETTKVRKIDNNQVTTADGVIVTGGEVVLATFTPPHREQLIHTFQAAEGICKVSQFDFNSSSVTRR